MTSPQSHQGTTKSFASILVRGEWEQGPHSGFRDFVVKRCVS